MYISSYFTPVKTKTKSILQKCRENLSCISSKQLSCHPQKVRPPVHSFHQHQYAVVEGIEVVELSWLTTVWLVGVGRLWMGFEARSTWNAPVLSIEVASSADVVFLSKSWAGTKSSDLGGSWKPEYIVTHQKTETQNWK